MRAALNKRVHLPPQDSMAWTGASAPGACDPPGHAFTPPRKRAGTRLVCACGVTELVATPARDGGWDLEVIREAHSAPPEAPHEPAERPQEGGGG